mmetsp:Transcript_44156/g.94019  ORF Transcript_44156/g.94019 Transcript_44156/m.94019 type:complete len:207 (-) Transcript_44156:421-1041(-)
MARARPASTCVLVPSASFASPPSLHTASLARRTTATASPSTARWMTTAASTSSPPPWARVPSRERPRTTPLSARRPSRSTSPTLASTCAPHLLGTSRRSRASSAGSPPTSSPRWPALSTTRSRCRRVSSRGSSTSSGSAHLRTRAAHKSSLARARAGGPRLLSCAPTTRTELWEVPPPPPSSPLNTSSGGGGCVGRREDVVAAFAH